MLLRPDKQLGKTCFFYLLIFKTVLGNFLQGSHINQHRWFSGHHVAKEPRLRVGTAARSKRTRTDQSSTCMRPESPLCKHIPSTQRRLQMVSVLRICLNFLQTRATLGNAVPGSNENISTKSSGGKSANDCGSGNPVAVRSRQSLLLTWPPPQSQASLGPAVTTTPFPGPPPPPTPTPTCRRPTIRSSPSSSMSESLPWSCWFCRCRLLHLRDWPTPQSLAQTAMGSHQRGTITSQDRIYQLQCGGHIPSDVTDAHVQGRNSDASQNDWNYHKSWKIVFVSQNYTWNKMKVCFFACFFNALLGEIIWRKTWL